MAPLITVSIIAERTFPAIAKAQEALKKGADLVEFRLDYMRKINLERLVVPEIPSIITNRHRDEGGSLKFDGSERSRRHSLKQAAGLGAKYIDIELNSLDEDFLKGIDRDKTKIIVSYHNFDETPENLNEIYRKMVDQGADIVKIATKPNNRVDTARMLNLIEAADKETIGICMGEMGKTTRIFDKNYLTFCALNKEECSAPGQYTIDELAEHFK